jgi:hypothetical protein
MRRSSPPAAVRRTCGHQLGALLEQIAAGVSALGLSPTACASATSITSRWNVVRSATCRNIFAPANVVISSRLI